MMRGRRWAIACVWLVLGVSTLDAQFRMRFSRSAADLPTPLTPIVTVTGPVEDGGIYSTSNTSETIYGTAVDDGTIQSVTYSVSGTVTSSPAVVGTDSWTFTPTWSQSGDKVYTITITDNAGLQTVVTVTIRFTAVVADTTPPVGAITIPTSGTSATVAGLSTPLGGTCTDNASSCIVAYSNAAGGSGSCTVTGGTYDCGTIVLAEGAQVVTVTFRDQANNIGTPDTVTLTGQAPISISTGTLGTCTAGVAFSKQLVAAGGTQSGQTWSKTIGNFPSGLSISTGGLISGTPGTGTETFTISVTDSGTNTATREFTLVCGVAGTESRHDHFEELSTHPNMIQQVSFRQAADILVPSSGGVLNDNGPHQLYVIDSVGSNPAVLRFAQTASTIRTLTTCTAGNPTVCTVTDHTIDDDDLVLVSGFSLAAGNGEMLAQKINGTTISLPISTTDNCAANCGFVTKLARHGCDDGMRSVITGHSTAAINATWTFTSTTRVDAYHIQLNAAGVGTGGTFVCHFWYYDPDNDTDLEAQDATKLWLGRDMVNLPTASQLYIPIARNSGEVMVVSNWLFTTSFFNNIVTLPGRWKALQFRANDGPNGEGNIYWEYRWTFDNAVPGYIAKLDMRTYGMSNGTQSQLATGFDQTSYTPTPSTSGSLCADTAYNSQQRLAVSKVVRFYQYIKFNVPGTDFTDWIACHGRTPGLTTVTGSTTTAGVTTVTTSAAHNYSANHVVTISTSSDAALNGTFVIVAVPTTTTFTVACVACGSGGAASAVRHFNMGASFYADEDTDIVRITWKVPLNYVNGRYMSKLNIELDTSSPDTTRPGPLVAYLWDVTILHNWTLDTDDTVVMRKPVP